LSAVPSNRDFTPGSAHERPTVEESPSDFDLVGILREAAASGSRPLESIMEAVADAARVLSGADGTALGLETKGIILCRARSGNIAPPIGAPISAESGISGECLRTVTMLVCHDAMTDPRVDADVCRSLGIRSVAAVPVRGPVRVAGILEAFSARPNAFDGDALRALRDLTEIAETAYRREFPAYTPAPKPPAPPLPPISKAVPEFVRPAKPVAAPLTITEEPFDGFQQLGKNRGLKMAAIAGALLLVVGVAWWSWRTPADETPSASAASATPQNVRAATPEPPHAAEALELIPKPAPGVVPPHSGHSRDVAEKAVDLKPIDLRSEDRRAAAGKPDTIEVRAPVRRAGDTSSVPEPPAVDLAPATNSQDLARLTSVPAQMPVAAPRVSQGVVEARLIHRVEPVYPSQARTQRMQGKVILSARIGADGSVRQVDVVGGSPVLGDAAKAAVLKWRYSPALLNGNPIEVQKEIDIIFAQP
jgi:TonB family protein